MEISAKVRSKILYAFPKERIVEYKKIKARLESWEEDETVTGNAEERHVKG